MEAKTKNVWPAVKGNIQQLHILPFRNAVEQDEEICNKLTNKRKYAKLHIEEATIVAL